MWKNLLIKPLGPGIFSTRMVLIVDYGSGVLFIYYQNNLYHLFVYINTEHKYIKLFVEGC